MTRGRVFDVQTYAIHDGPGIRTAVFLAGCPLRCAWCHNPEAWCGGGEKVREMEAEELVELVCRDLPFFERSGGGVTFTGGEPTVQSAFLLESAGLLRARGVHTAVETCGHFPAELCEPLADVLDLFLFDLKHCDPVAHAAGTRADNGAILANLRRLVDLVGVAGIVPRIPVVPGFNADDASLKAMAGLLSELGFGGREVHLLAYHGWARHKYGELGLDFTEFDPVPDGERPSIGGTFSEAGLVPVWGGGT